MKGLDNRLGQEISNLQEEKQPKELSSSIAGETTVEGCLTKLNADLTVLLTGTITAGNTSLTISNTKITTSSIIDIYFEDKVLAPTNVTVTTGQIVIEIAKQDSNVNVGVRIL